MITMVDKAVMIAGACAALTFAVLFVSVGLVHPAELDNRGFTLPGDVAFESPGDNGISKRK